MTKAERYARLINFCRAFTGSGHAVQIAADAAEYWRIFDCRRKAVMHFDDGSKLTFDFKSKKAEPQ